MEPVEVVNKLYMEPVEIVNILDVMPVEALNESVALTEVPNERVPMRVEVSTRGATPKVRSGKRLRKKGRLKSNKTAQAAGGERGEEAESSRSLKNFATIAAT